MSAEGEFLRREKKEILTTIDLIEDLLGRVDLNRYEVVALGTLLHNVYKGVESVFRCVIVCRGYRIEKTEAWHKALLTKALNEGIVTQSEYHAFSDLLDFRHMHVHGYAHMLDEERLRALADPVPQLVRRFLDKDWGVD